MRLIINKLKSHHLLLFLIGDKIDFEILNFKIDHKKMLWIYKERTFTLCDFSWIKKIYIYIYIFTIIGFMIVYFNKTP